MITASTAPAPASTAPAWRRAATSWRRLTWSEGVDKTAVAMGPTYPAGRLPTLALDPSEHRALDTTMEPVAVAHRRPDAPEPLA